jgi:glycerol kinase
MKKLLLLLLALSLIFMVTWVSAMSDNDKSETVNGWVSDSQCAAKGAVAGHEACAKKCLGKGAKMVVVTDTDKQVLTVDNPDALAGHEGHHVALTGHVSGDSIHVESAKML